MGILKNAKESPNSTKSGVIGAVVTLAIGVIVTLIAPKNPELAKVIEGSEGAIMTIAVSIASIIALIGANKKD